MQAEEIRTKRHSLGGACRGSLVVALVERLVGGFRRRVGVALQRRTVIGDLGTGSRRTEPRRAKAPPAPPEMPSGSGIFRPNSPCNQRYANPVKF